jgi:hypothetical protein
MFRSQAHPASEHAGSGPWHKRSTYYALRHHTNCGTPSPKIYFYILYNGPPYPTDCTVPRLGGGGLGSHETLKLTTARQHSSVAKAPLAPVLACSTNMPIKHRLHIERAMLH